MLFGKRKTAGRFFREYYSSMLKTANSFGTLNNPEFELLPAMFVVADYATACANKPRQSVASEIMQEIENVGCTFDSSEFDRRCDLYGEIIRRSRKLRCEWVFFDSKPFEENSISRCAAALGDILWNSECADDYDNAPVTLRDFFEALSFCENVMKQFMKSFQDFADSIYKL